MNKMFLLLSVVIAYPVFAGDLWEINSTSIGPDGKPQPYTQKTCFPNGSLDPSKVLEGIGNCTFDQKSGNASAMSFVMTCKTAGTPTDQESMKVSGDARLNGDKFDMRYSISMGGTQTLPGGNFQMDGNAEARKIGLCEER